ncbi:stage V sporulation protein AF [Geomicrobium halophilum]|uniref:Stage V sporulation protein AF n=1 Tax=Geomicrobium halophilum TaxID=549000 RepID=A0A841PZW1_9BACL|nr:spore germination protein [Geomicrobium halophilum]MBB6448408.1 stage V sporulation protein AF [Geomicrobium halophilum]
MRKRAKKLGSDYESNVSLLQKQLRVDKNFDIVEQEYHFGGKAMSLYALDAFANDLVVTQIIENLSKLEEGALSKDPLTRLEQSMIPIIELEREDVLEELITQILSGQAALIVEGCSEAILMDVREYPVREPQEPDMERVARGSKDGFVETLVFNSGLIRRRVRDPALIMEPMQVGRRSKTDVVISYIDNVADPELMRRLKKKINAIDIDGVPMAEKTIEEFLIKKSLVPFPQVRYTERPDTAAVHLMEGHVLILVDGSNVAMIVPTTYFHHLQHAEEYRQEPIVGFFLRWVRFLAVFVSIFLLPVWFLIADNEALGPDVWGFIGVEEDFNIPIFWQILIAEFGLQVLRMAAIHTPDALATALGLVAAILIGEIGVETGVFTNEVVMYAAVSAMAGYATPSYELGLCNVLIRIALVLSVGFFSLYGFLIIGLIIFLMLVKTKILNTPYLWPFLPFNAKALSDLLLRMPMPYKNHRPSFVHPLDSKRQATGRKR